ncbi:hypothetical protein CP556_00445 [Natrinema sp. CBA1119]|uniref:hypothetical protein n=1 Tax=Natrinema sp. CBA1119 TaxID=1608465 RepID=UPI000BF97431|nr:hypothetical protein [Natrinema sp. CBA1119]PGF14734.1 hypothetical protein CP556_00445 [Natrinema sp. CBA1119]
MSTRPTGTILDDDRLLELRETDETAASELAVEVTPVAEFMGASSGDQIDWDVDQHEDQPMLVFSGIEDAATADAPYPRELREENGEIVAPVPDPLVRAEPPAGLGIALEVYDAGRPLLFDAITVGETIGLIPIRFDDGEAYRPEPLPDVADDSDPVAEEVIEREDRGDPTPRPETMDAPIDPDVLESTLAEADDSSEADVIGILEAVETHDLVGTGDHVAGVPPLSVDERAVCLLPEDVWTERLGPELEAEGVDVTTDALAVARETHDRQARALIDAAETTEYEGVVDEYALVVTNARDTTEWDVAEPGMNR